jgi:cytochrome c-type biogenesis protein CcmH/NrfG
VQTSPGLPARIYLPIVAIIAIVFLGVMGYLVNKGFDVTGSLFGTGTSTSAASNTPSAANAQNAVEGGPPAPVMEQLRTLRARIAAHPHDDVALTQLGDMYLASNQFAKAVPFYERALQANPGNIAAKTGLQQAKTALTEQR